MARKHDAKAMREAIGALVELETPVEEIREKLANDECELGYPVEISRRAVYYHRTAYLEQKRRTATQLDSATESIAATKQLAVELLRRELLALMNKREGTMTVAQAGAVERIHKALCSMERTERGKGRSKPTGSNGNQPEKSESVMERLAREAREQQQPGVGSET